MRYSFGIDVGGTFTDFVAYNRESGLVEAWKVSSVPGDPVAGILDGLERHRHKGDISNIRLGTTVATNLVLERKGAKIAYITTRGFKDVPFIQRGNRKHHYDMTWVKPKPLVERWNSYEVDERVDAHGNVLTPLNEDDVRDIAKEIAKTSEIEAIAICFLFSYLNPAHELRTREILAETLPNTPISISYEVLPKWKEYERATTTLADAYMKPAVSRQLIQMRSRLDQGGIKAPTVLIKSNGGETTLTAAANSPVGMVMSGPTGGVVASRSVAALVGIDRMVTLDMGGTSTDVSTVMDGHEALTTAFEIEWGVPIQVPMIDIRTIGAGGGSIAWIDKGGMLRVGPQSAGAKPGPACYGRGGELATVTDANVLLGRIDPFNFLGGRMKLDGEAARRAVSVVAKALNQTPEETALAIIRIANNNMIGALRSVLIEGGLDPRDFTLCAFGGAGPPHACDLIADMGIPRAIIPNHPGQFSAYGFVMTDARVDRQRSTQLTNRDFDPDKGSAVMKTLVAEAIAELYAQGYKDDIEVFRVLEMRYLGQNYELELPIAPDALNAGLVENLWNQFHEAHQVRFGFSTPGEIIEIVTYSVTVVSRTAKPDLPKLAKASGKATPMSRRKVGFTAGTFDVPVYDRYKLLSGHVIDGPAVIEEAASVTILNSGQRLRVDDFGHLIVDAEPI